MVGSKEEVGNLSDTRLIESAFPLRQVSRASVHEKSVRHGHVSTLHVWPARRSRAARRAALLPVPGAKTSGGGCWRGWRRSCGGAGRTRPSSRGSGRRSARRSGGGRRGRSTRSPGRGDSAGGDADLGVERAWLRASYSPMAGRGLPCTIGVPWLPMPAWRSPGWRNASRKEDTASPSPRFAGDSPGDGVTSSARTEVRWTNGRWYDNSPAVSRCCRREGAGRDRADRMPCPDAAGGREPAVTARDRMPVAPSGDPDCTGVEARCAGPSRAHAGRRPRPGGEVVFQGGEVVREKPGREPGSAPGPPPVRRATRPKNDRRTRARGGHRDRGWRPMSGTLKTGRAVQRHARVAGTGGGVR